MNKIPVLAPPHIMESKECWATDDIRESGENEGKRQRNRVALAAEKRLTVSRKPLKKIGAGDEIRTHDINLGKAKKNGPFRAVEAKIRLKSGILKKGGQFPVAFSVA